MESAASMSSLVVSVLINPILSQLEKENSFAAQTLSSAIRRAEIADPSILLDFVLGILKKTNLTININERLLRLQGIHFDLKEYTINSSDNVLQEVYKISTTLKCLLSKIPEEIIDLPIFCNTIRQIGRAIENYLDAIDKVIAYIPRLNGKQSLELNKVKFRKSTKIFTGRLKDYFQQGDSNLLFESALSLVVETNVILATIKNVCE